MQAANGAAYDDGRFCHEVPAYALGRRGPLGGPHARGDAGEHEGLGRLHDRDQGRRCVPRRRGPPADARPRRRSRSRRTATRSSPTGPSPRRRSSSAASTCSSARTSTRRSPGRRKIPMPGGKVEVRPVMDYEAARLGRPLAGSGGAAVGAPDEAVDRLFREESGRAVAALIRVLGDFDLAEEAVQDAFLVALEVWPRRGLPRNPGRVDHHDCAEQGDRPPPPRAPARGQGAGARGARAAVRGGRGGRGGRQHHPRRPAAADLHLLPPGARARGAGRAHAPHPRRPEHARDRPRVPHLGAGDAAAARPGQAEDPRRAHPVRRPARPRAARPARLGARRALPHLQRGLRRDGERGARPARALRRGDPADPGAARA